MRAVLALIAALVLLAGCTSEDDAAEGGGETEAPAVTTAPREVTTAEVPPEESPARVLVVTATAAFEHGVIPFAEQTFEELGEGSEEYDVSLTSLEDFPGALADADAVVFALTSGELPLSSDARLALVDFVAEGKGFVGVHSATDTFYEFPGYQRLIGSYFRDHPYTDGTLVRVRDDHPATASLPERMPVAEELYRFREDIRFLDMVPLLELQDVDGASDEEYLPSAWCGRVGEGRTLYSALGHFEETWEADWFRDHLDGAIAWAAGTRESDACDV